MLPVNVHDPPALSVIEKLNAVDAAHKRFGIVFVMTRLINAPDMSNVAKLFGAPRDLFFVESIPLKERFDARDEPVDVLNLRREIDILRSSLHRGWNQTRTWKIQRALAIPIVLLSGWA